MTSITLTDLSAPQQKVLDVLMTAPKALSAYDILDQLQQTGIKSPPTVYRALDKLATLGLIHRIESLNAFVACCQYHTTDCGHDHDHADAHASGHISQFAICTHCSRVQEIENEALASVINDATASFLSNVDKKVFELSGICHACAKALATAG